MRGWEVVVSYPDGAVECIRPLRYVEAIREAAAIRPNGRDRCPKVGPKKWHLGTSDGPRAVLTIGAL